MNFLIRVALVVGIAASIHFFSGVNMGTALAGPCNPEVQKCV